MDVGLAVGSAFLSSALNVFFDRMTPKFPYLFRGSKGVELLLRKLKTTLLAINAVLDDAEDKQISNRDVKEWLFEVKHSVYDAEDLVDEINTEALQLEEVEARDHIMTYTVRHLSHEFLKEMIPKIEEVVSTLEYFVSQINILGLERRGVMKQDALSRLPSTSLVNESEVYGRDNEREKLIDMVLNDNEGNGNNVSVIPIVGMGGLGKTTLAQLVYNDERVKKHFDKRVWVCVSENYDAFKITQTLVGKICGGFGEKDDLDMLQVKLQESLMASKFLIILDDVWNGNYNDWDKLEAPLKGSGRQGSVILVTTRDECVAKMMQTQDICYIDPISHENCLSLFKRHAFNNGHTLASLEFERIGEEIVKKCKGLPLAIKTIGGLLRSKTKVKEWFDILRSDFWDLDDKPNDILPVLRLSYHHLPPHLKHCFAFCAIFPKNYTLDEEALVLLWMANDLLQQPSGDDKTTKSMEDVGRKYFSQLISRSFFQKMSDGGYIMHDLLNDLARYVFGKFCFRSEDHHPREVSTEVRHFSYVPRSFVAFEKFNFLRKLKRLRTFFPIRPEMYDTNARHYISTSLSKVFLPDILPGLERLRVLSLSGYRINELSDSLGNLKHLRYVNLSKTYIEHLPDAICGLHNLQTLLLSHCYFLHKLPKNITKLVNLHHLNLKGTELTKMPSHMSKLRSLQTLSYFIVYDTPGRRIEELGKLSLCGYLKIKGLQNVTSCSDAIKACLRNKNHLEELILEWSGNTGDSQIDRDIFEKLQPDINLKTLTVCGYGGTRFPDWLADNSFCNIASLCLRKCKNCFILPTLGHLASLKSLTINGLHSITRIGEEFYGNGSLFKPFESLVTLTIEQMPKLVEWDTPPYAHFSRLEKLCIRHCPKLKGKLPHRLASLRDFEIFGCQQLVCLNDWICIAPNNHVDSISHHLSSLQHVSISDMPNLKELPEVLFTAGLKDLTIQRCDGLVSFPKVMARIENMILSDCSSLVSLPIMGSSTHVTNCAKLEFPICENSEDLYGAVEDLHIVDASFKNNALGLFPKLQTLRFEECESLKVFPSLQNSTLLRELEIFFCNNLLCFPKGGLPAPNLEDLSIIECKKLKSLPEQMHSLLPSLRCLYVSNCPEIESFPQGGLPSNLEGLGISDCEKLLKNRKDWGLQKLPALCDFWVCKFNEESFPDEGMLPCSIRCLQISDNNNLKTLNRKGLLDLTSLEALYITGCPNLQSLPGVSLPSSIKSLDIANCSNLRSLPEEGLPSSLFELEVDECPMLNPHLEREAGKYWPKIAHIPIIVVDNELIS